MGTWSISFGYAREKWKMTLGKGLRLHYTEYRKQLHKKSPGLKYRNTPTKRDGISFDSIAEADFYDHLKFLKQVGEVEYFDVHPVFLLTGNIKYEADFTVYWTPTGDKICPIEVVDVKGVETRDFVNKKKLFDATHPLSPLCLIKRRGKDWDYRRDRY